jgi:hypothetical protein
VLLKGFPYIESFCAAFFCVFEEGEPPWMLNGIGTVIPFPLKFGLKF